MPSPSHLSIRTLLLWLVLACLLPGVAGAVLLFSHQYQEGRVQQQRNTLQTARALMLAVDSHLLRVQAIGEALAAEDSLVKGDLARFHAQARKVMQNSGLAANIVLRGKNEQLVVNALIDFGQPLPVQPTREHVQRVFSTGKPVISPLYRVPQFQHPIVSVDLPVQADGEVRYSLGVSVFPQQLNTILAAQSLPPGWVAAVLDSSGTIVSRNITPEKFLGNKATPLLLRALVDLREGSIEATSQEGIAVETSFSRSAATNWVVAIGIPQQSLREAMILSLARLAAGIASMFGVGLLLAWFMGGRIARSVAALTVPATALGRGAAVQLPYLEVKEAADVGAALVHASELLHQRAAAISRKESELAEAHTRLRDVIDSSPALIYLKNLKGEYLLFNKAYERLLGNDLVQPGTQPRQDTLTAYAGHDHGPNAADLEVLQSGGPVQFEEAMDTSEGLKYFAVSKAPLRSHEGEIVGICGAAVDVTSLKVAEAQIRELVATLEKRVEQRTMELHAANDRLLEVNEQLNEANQQLEAFSYTVAHDLRAPLRGIQGFADAIAEDNESTLDATGQNYLHRIARAAARMEQLIDDLLLFSRLARMELPLGPVALEEILRQVNTNLSTQIRSINAGLHIAPGLPVVHANKTACLQVFQNLVSNALKFSPPDRPVVVRVWADACSDEHKGTKWVRIWVEDNGIGIPEAHQQRIFRPFERLHGMSEYPGSGIGLTIVEKAVRRMHGRCGVESEVNIGSRFWIELPVSGMED
jgi:PAS domain S-box-containing protein